MLTTGWACRVQWGSTLKVTSSLRWGLPLTEAGRSEGVSRDGRGANKGIHTARCVQRGLKAKTKLGLQRRKQEGTRRDSNTPIQDRQERAIDARYACLLCDRAAAGAWNASSSAQGVFRVKPLRSAMPEKTRVKPGR